LGNTFYRKEPMSRKFRQPFCLGQTLLRPGGVYWWSLLL